MNSHRGDAETQRVAMKRLATRDSVRDLGIRLPLSSSSNPRAEEDDEDEHEKNENTIPGSTNMAVNARNVRTSRPVPLPPAAPRLTGCLN